MKYEKGYFFPDGEKIAVLLQYSTVHVQICFMQIAQKIELIKNIGARYRNWQILKADSVYDIPEASRLHIHNLFMHVENILVYGMFLCTKAAHTPPADNPQNIKIL